MRANFIILKEVDIELEDADFCFGCSFQDIDLYGSTCDHYHEVLETKQRSNGGHSASRLDKCKEEFGNGI